MELTILQWNIHGLVSKATNLLQYIHTHNTAVVVLQETLVTDASTMRLGRYQLFQQPHQPGGSRGLITLVRPDIPATLTENPQPLGEQVDSLGVTIHIDHATKIDIYNVYCRQRSTLNLQPVMEDNDGRTTLLSGDFNAHHDALEPWNNGPGNQRGRHITQVLREFPEVMLLGPPHPTHIAGGRLDLTFLVNGGGQQVEVHSIPELLSDHWAQEYSISVTRLGNDEASSPRRKWATQKADWRVFTALMNSWYRVYQVPQSVHAFADDLTAAIQVAANTSMPLMGKKKYNPNKPYLWYYDERVKFYTRVSRRLTKLYLATRSEVDKTNLQEWTTYAREQLNVIREEKWLKSMENLGRATSMTQVWRKINSIRGKYKRPPAHPNPAGKAEELMREYHERSSTNGLPQQLQETKHRLDPARLHTVITATSLPDDTDRPITRDELLRARRMSSDTAPGKDGITYSMLNAVCSVEGDPLLRLFNMSLAQGALPEAWTTATIVPVPKQGEDEKYRPISLTPTLCKMLERILLTRLQYKIGKLCTSVNGYVRHRSTANCLANYAANNTAKTTVFIDVEKAFDRAQPLVILEELSKLGVKGRLLEWIQRYLTNRRARVLFQGKASPYFSLENGTPQGGVISPTLFNVLMNALATLPYPEGTQHLSYADDIVLQTSGKDSVARMQDSLDMMAARCGEIGFTVSQRKTKAMAKTRNAPQVSLRLQGQAIDWVTTHRYLGVTVAKNGSCTAEIQHLREKCRLRNRVLKAMSWKGMGASRRVILHMYKTLVRTVIDYASPVLLNMTDRDARALETIQNEALRYVLGAPKWSKTQSLRAEAQVPTLTDRVRYMAANLALKTAVRADHPDDVHRLLHRHHEDHRGGGRWINKAAAALCAHGVSWEEVREASVTQVTPTRPPWGEPSLCSIIRPPRRRKRELSDAELHQEGLQTIYEAWQPQTAAYFTDGSSDPQTGRSGAAFVCVVRGEDAQGGAMTTRTSAARTSDHSSSTQTELAAIHMALEHAITSHTLHVLINTDSMTAIHSLSTQHSEHQHLTHTVHAAASALHDGGRTITINWIPSHVGIRNNERADMLAKQGAQLPLVTIKIPRSLRYLQGKIRTRAVLRRQRQEREAQAGDSPSSRWYGEVAAAARLCHPSQGESRRTEVVRSRIRLGYQYGWQLGIAATEEQKQCRLCGERDGHALQHYLRDCPRVREQRNQCTVPSPTLAQLAVHFLDILPQTLRVHPNFCAITP